MHKGIFGSLALVLAMVSGGAVAQDMNDWDYDSDGFVSTTDYYNGVYESSYYSTWDGDDNGLLDEDEFNSLGVDASYDDWDSNSDGYLDSNEVYGGYYDYYDSNEDGHWDNGEWDDAYEDGFFDI